MPKVKLKKGCAKYFLQLFQAFSLDVVLGALAMGSFASKIMGIHPKTGWYFVLAAAVWIIYTTDHLIDGLFVQNNASLFRHQLHFIWRKPIIVLVILLAISSFLYSLWYLNSTIILGGLILALGVTIYLVLILLVANKRNFYFQKEFFISIFYVLGIWLAPLVWYAKIPDTQMLIVFILFVVLVWSEGLTASTFDFDADRQDKHQSFSTHFGKSKTKKFVNGLLSATLLVSLYFVYKSSEIKYQLSFGLLIIMTISLFIFNYLSSNLKKWHSFRAFGEIIFWLPALFCFF